MPIFTWEALTKEGARKSGESEAADRTAVIRELERQNLLPVRITVKTAKSKRRVWRRGGGKIKAMEKVLLCRHLAVMVRAGIGMNPALTILINDTEKPAMRGLLQTLQDTIRRGQPLWSAFSSYGSGFPKYMVGLIRAGELSGRLAESFDQSADQLMREYRSGRRAMSAMVYPLILLSISTVLVFFLLVFAIPKIAEAVREISTDLPLFSRIVFTVSAFFNDHMLLSLLTLAAVFTAMGAALFSRMGRKALSAIAWRFPPSRNFLKKFALARFARTLGSLMQAGLPAVEAVEITADSVGVEAIRLAVLDARERIRRGSNFVDAFRGYPEYFPNFLTGIMAVGEQSGQLSELLITISNFFEEDADRALQTLVSLIEPMLLLMMGIVVGVLALSVIVPIYQLVGQI